MIPGNRSFRNSIGFGGFCAHSFRNVRKGLFLHAMIFAVVFYSLLGSSVALRSDVEAGRLILSAVSRAKSEAEVLDSVEIMPAEAVINLESRRRGEISEDSGRTLSGWQVRFLGAFILQHLFSAARMRAIFLLLVILSVLCFVRQIISYIHARDGAKSLL